MARSLQDCGCDTAIYTMSGHGIADRRVTEMASKEDILGSLSAVDVVIDGMGIAGEDSIPMPDTWVSHRASMDLIRRVWGHLMSKGSGSWKEWRD